MARPTRFCKKCGEYVAEKNVYNSGNDRFEEKLVHIDGVGNTIYRSHQAVEEQNGKISEQRG